MNKNLEMHYAQCNKYKNNEMFLVRNNVIYKTVEKTCWKKGKKKKTVNPECYTW